MIIDKKYLAFSVAVVVGMLTIWHFREPRVNNWPMVNAPAGDGAILCYGDSLVAGVGADSEEQKYPRRLGVELARTVRAVGTPGMTSEDGLKQLLLNPSLRADVVVVTLGGNDILARIPLDDTIENLGGIFREFQRRGALVAFTGVDGPFTSRTKPFKKACKQNGVILIPSVLAGILDDPGWKSYQFHSNRAGYAVMAQRVASILKPFLD